MNQKIKKGLTYLGKCLICLSILTTIFGCSSSIEKIFINESQITMDINEEKSLNLEFTPDDSTIKIDDFQISDNNVIEIKKIDNQKLYIHSLDHEGKITIQYKTDDVESNIVNVQVIDQKALALAKAKKQAEEEAQKKAEEEKLKAEEAQKKAEEEKIKAQEAQKKIEEEKKKEESKKTTSTKSSTTKNNQTTKSTSSGNTSSSTYVYIPSSGSGNKYHSRSQCGRMKESDRVTLSEAKRLGHDEPCKNCH